MSKEFEELFIDMHPGFFDKDYIQNQDIKSVFKEMIIDLKDYSHDAYKKEFGSDVTFGFYKGGLEDLRKIVSLVDVTWPQIFKEDTRVYCGFINGEVASFCMVEDMGVHSFCGKNIKVGGPGCVGTVPKYRNRGIGLTMVNDATQILKDEGYDISYIHFTGVAGWYAKLGYKEILSWKKTGFINREIVHATKDDAKEVLALYKAQIGKKFCAWDDHYPSAETIEFDLSRDSLFLMKENGRIISAISIDYDEAVINLSCWSDSLLPGGELSRLVVSEDCQNQGIARKMLTYGMDILKERGYKSAHFLVNKYNETAINSYRHLNFNSVGECEMFDQPFWCFEKEL